MSSPCLCSRERKGGGVGRGELTSRKYGVASLAPRKEAEETCEVTRTIKKCQEHDGPANSKTNGADPKRVIQGETSRCFQSPVDLKTKVAF